MGGRRRLGQGKLDCITHEQQKSEKSLFRQQIEVLNMLLRSDLHYLPLYKRRWSFASYPSPLSSNKFECQTDSSVLKIALPRTGKETHPAFGSNKDGVKKMASHAMHLVPEKNELDSRLRSSRAHGQRLHCEVLGSETCQKCIRILDQTSVENICPLCMPFKQRYGSLAHSDFRKQQSTYNERGTSTGNALYTPVQVFHRVREKESGDERIARKRFRFQGEQPIDKILTNKHTTSHLPSNLPALLVSHNDSACISEEAEEEVGTNCELKVRVTFGNTSLSAP